jgi:hypothetical protein
MGHDWFTWIYFYSRYMLVLISFSFLQSLSHVDWHNSQQWDTVQYLLFEKLEVCVYFIFSHQYNHLTGLVDVPTLNSTLIWSLALYFLIWNVSPFQLLLFIHLVFFSWASSWYNFQDFTTRYSTLIMIGIEHKHKVLSQMDSILMGLMPEVLIMLLIG